ncbi:SDR family NAD(P)-dependent oxidoreductase [Maribellus sediminis]|uniref:SDR family NAD(P)-dependent oxidoreductase n=1 Tax=Maribellus sediminis TaxID=2696285 RepID=UPI0014313AC9|nr:SDR family NAD(P)-dependent oxidoreductase [Maribellus sediminis]
MNKTALITGGSKRIGRAITEHLAKKGWNVIIHFNHSAETAIALVQDLIAEYPKQLFSSVTANLANIHEVVSLIPNIVEKRGPFDLLVNNASVFNKGAFHETSEELFDSQVNVNFKAPFFLMRDFAKYCKKGNIINFVDTRITNNKSDYAAYSLSKKALWESTKMAALELAPEIRINAIAPGVTLAPADEGEEYLQKLAENIPMKKPGGVEPILRSIDYILENDHLAGQLLFADGGENLGTNG